MADRGTVGEARCVAPVDAMFGHGGGEYLHLRGQVAFGLSQSIVPSLKIWTANSAASLRFAMVSSVGRKDYLLKRADGKVSGEPVIP